MNLQYISDSNGETTGVFIPISEWNELKNKYKGIETEHSEIPSWHKDEVRERIADFKKNPEIAVDFISALEDIERDI